MEKKLVSRRTVLLGGMAAGACLGSLGITDLARAGPTYGETTVVCGSDGLRPDLRLILSGSTIPGDPRPYLKLFSGLGLNQVTYDKIGRLTPDRAAQRLLTPATTTDSMISVVLAGFHGVEEARCLVELVRKLGTNKNGFLFVVSPFAADAGETEILIKHCDGLIRLPGIRNAADEVMPDVIPVVRGLINGIYCHGFIGFDLVDLLEVFHEGRWFSFGRGCCRHAEIGSHDAADQALNELRAQGQDPAMIRCLLMGISGDDQTTLTEINDLATKVQQAVHGDAIIMFYAIIRQKLVGQVEVSLLASA